MVRVLRRAAAWNGPLVTTLGLALALGAGLLIVRLPLLDGALFVGLAVLGVATLIEPLAGVGGALFLGPLRAYLSQEVPAVPDQIGQLFVALALASWLGRGLARRDLRLPAPPLLLPLLAFAGAALLSLWDAVDPAGYGILELVKWVQIVLLFLLVADRLTPRRLPWLLGALLATGFFQAGVGLWQFALRGDGPDHFAILEEGFYRAYGTFEQPNPYGGYLGLTLALAVGVVIGVFFERRKGGKGRFSPLLPFSSSPLSPFLLVSLSLCLLLLAALVASWSRGAWMGFGAAVVAMAFALPRRARWGLLLVAVLVGGSLGLYAAGLLPPSLAARLTGFYEYVRFEDVRGVGINDANYAIVERQAHWQAALEMWRYDLWTGVGIGCYEPAYSAYALVNWPIALGHAHNIYLNVVAETGLLGLAAYLLLWGAVFWQTWRATRRARGFPRGLAIGLLGAWTHLSVHHLIDNLYVNNVHLHVGVLLGLVAWVASGQASRCADPRTKRARNVLKGGSWIDSPAGN